MLPVLGVSLLGGHDWHVPLPESILNMFTSQADVHIDASVVDKREKQGCHHGYQRLGTTEKKQEETQTGR